MDEPVLEKVGWGKAQDPGPCGRSFVLPEQSGWSWQTISSHLGWLGRQGDIYRLQDPILTTQRLSTDFKVPRSQTPARVSFIHQHYLFTRIAAAKPQRGK